MPIPATLPTTPRAVADALKVVTDANLAATLPETIRSIAFLIVASQHGRTIPQRHRPAPPRGQR